MRRIPFSHYRAAVLRLEKQFGGAPDICIETGTSGPAFEQKNNPVTFSEFLKLPFGENTYIDMADGHVGMIDVIEVSGKRVCVIQGRIHYYQGYTIEQVVFLSRVMAMWGCKKFLFTNASGSLHSEYLPETLVNLTDHIRMDIPDPLIGVRDKALGNVFTSMRRPYTLSGDIHEIMLKHTGELQPLKVRGTYVTRSGPTFESLPECKLLKDLHAHIVGMSTVPNVIVLRSLGLDVGAISLVTNHTLVTEDGTEVSHEDNSAVARAAAPRLILLLTKVIEQI